MKSTQFNRRPASIKVLKEPPKKKRTNWDKLIYLILLGFALFYTAKWIIFTYLFIEAEGHVIFKKLDIVYTSDIQLTALYIHEGQHVEEGDSLFSFIKEDNLVSHGSTGENVRLYNNHINWINKERIQIIKEITSRKIEKEYVEELLEGYQEEEEILKKEILVGIYAPDKLIPYSSKVMELKVKLASLEQEIGYYQRHLAQVQNLPFREGGNLYYPEKGNGPLMSAEIHHSPIKGTITRVFKGEHELVKESDFIMSIHTPDNVLIKAFFHQKDLSHLEVGDHVDVKFPDGTTSEGIIERFYTATYELPEEFQERHEPLQRVIAADIYPIHEEEAANWRVFYKMSVEVSKHAKLF